MREVSRKVKKARDNFAKRKRIEQQVVDAVSKAFEKDPRAYAGIELEGTKIRGLLDTGPSVSILGRDCRELLNSLETDVDGEDSWRSKA